TRADICDMPTVRRRVLADELALAADVFDIEPLPLDDPLLGRHNVVHTPHNAGRTRQANELYAAKVADQFSLYASLRSADHTVLRAHHGGRPALGIAKGIKTTQSGGLVRCNGSARSTANLGQIRASHRRSRHVCCTQKSCRSCCVAK